VTGRETGEPPEPERVRAVKAAVPEAPVFVASGVTEGNVADYAEADGFIVGTSVKRLGIIANEVDPARVARLVKAYRTASKRPRR
jgi:predicted TIM-barrel enzyme